MLNEPLGEHLNRSYYVVKHYIFFLGMPNFDA